jgi:hypothetical protein
MDFNKDEVMVILAALKQYSGYLQDLRYDNVYATADAKGQADLDNQAREVSNMIQRIRYKIFWEEK